MSTTSLHANWRFWAWVTTAFILGVVLGFVLCIVILVALTAMTSYAQ